MKPVALRSSVSSFRFLINPVCFAFLSLASTAIALGSPAFSLAQTTKLTDEEESAMTYLYIETLSYYVPKLNISSARQALLSDEKVAQQVKRYRKEFNSTRQAETFDAYAYVRLLEKKLPSADAKQKELFYRSNRSLLNFVESSDQLGPEEKAELSRRFIAMAPKPRIEPKKTKVNAKLEGEKPAKQLWDSDFEYSDSTDAFSDTRSIAWTKSYPKSDGGAVTSLRMTIQIQPNKQPVAVFALDVIDVAPRAGRDMFGDIYSSPAQFRFDFDDGTTTGSVFIGVDAPIERVGNRYLTTHSEYLFNGSISYGSKDFFSNLIRMGNSDQFQLRIAGSNVVKHFDVPKPVCKDIAAMAKTVRTWMLNNEPKFMSSATSWIQSQKLQARKDLKIKEAELAAIRKKVQKQREWAVEREMSSEDIYGERRDNPNFRRWAKIEADKTPSYLDFDHERAAEAYVEAETRYRELTAERDPYKKLLDTK